MLKRTFLCLASIIFKNRMQIIVPYRPWVQANAPPPRIAFVSCGGIDWETHVFVVRGYCCHSVSCKVRVECVYEPPQENYPEGFQVLDDPKADTVEALAGLLGLKRVRTPH